MKELTLEYKLIQSAPAKTSVDTVFTERVMRGIASPSLTEALKNTTQPKKRSLLYRLRHLPKFAVVILAIAILFTISGVTYAIVETVKNANVKVEQSGTNAFGREQLTVAFDSCAEEKKAGTTYELKKDSGLSTEDGAKVLQARCDLDYMDSWLENDQKVSGKDYSHGMTHAIATREGIVGTLRSTSDSDLTLGLSDGFTGQKRDKAFPFQPGVRIIEAGKEIDRNTLKPGDTLLYFSPRLGMRDPATSPPETIVIFKLGLDAKFYGLDMRSYVTARGACPGNPSRSCFLHNSINSVSLIASRGGAWSNPKNVSDVMAIKTIQGKVVSWNNSEIKLDVGDGTIYTVQTPSSVLDTYNRTTVYGLKSLDTIYAKTNPEALKIGVGDSLEIAYQENKDTSSQTLEWSQTLTIALMVERTIKDLEVLKKY